jgi:aldose 1-epimerase
MNLDPQIITDRDSGTTARVMPGLGFNCYSFRAQGNDGAVEILWSAADFLTGKSKPSHSGIPLLFPFAGRIRGTSFAYQGKQYPLEAGDGQGNAIHGFVLNRPWRVTRREDDRIVGSFQASIDDPALLDRWPADFRITADYRVSKNVLSTDYLIENPDAKPLPFGFGTHPYFRVPLGVGGAADCRVTAPVEYAWELEGLLPTGRTVPLPAAAELARGMAFGAMQLDNVFGGLSFDNHRATAKVHDPQAKRTMVMTFDDQFTTCVVYNPPHRQAVCIEPYTTAPDAFALIEAGIDPHLRVLPPGGAFRTRIEIRFE